MDADDRTDKEIEIENDGARPKCDNDAEEMTDNKIEENAVRPKSDMDAEAFDEIAKKKKTSKKEEMEQQQQKNTLEVNEEVSIQDRRLAEERRKKLPKVRNND